MYILEGNIGGGKSTFLRLIEQQIPQVSISLEPLHNWQKQVYGQSLLTNFYQEPKRWAYTFETLTLMCRVKEHLAHQQDNNHITILERSIYSGYHCFAQNSYTQGFMTKLEWELYQQWFTFLAASCAPPRGFIYLRVSPDVAYERSKKRNRYAEKNMSLAYLKQIHEQHEKLLIQKQGMLPELRNVPILTLDCNEEFETDRQKLHALVHRMQNFFAQTGTVMPEYKLQHVHQSY